MAYHQGNIGEYGAAYIRYPKGKNNHWSLHSLLVWLYYPLHGMKVEHILYIMTWLYLTSKTSSCRKISFRESDPKVMATVPYKTLPDSSVYHMTMKNGSFCEELKYKLPIIHIIGHNYSSNRHIDISNSLEVYYSTWLISNIYVIWVTNKN